MRVDTLCTQSYRAGFIHSGFYNGVERFRWEFGDESGDAVSFRAAQLMITRRMKKNSLEKEKN